MPIANKPVVQTQVHRLIGLIQQARKDQNTDSHCSHCTESTPKKENDIEDIKNR